VSIYREGPSPAGSCPRCRETLVDVDGLKGVRTCERCGGVFADNEASRRIVSSLDRVLLEVGFAAARGKQRAKDTGGALTCPECLVAMQKIRVESAACEIDACPGHGSWFDAGELQDVMRAYARRRDRGMLSPNRPPLSAEDIALEKTAADAKAAREEALKVHGSDLVSLVFDSITEKR
jgi:Zn-finger nucleic acid-binding protein